MAPPPSALHRRLRWLAAVLLSVAFAVALVCAVYILLVRPWLALVPGGIALLLLWGACAVQPWDAAAEPPEQR